jgi:glycosyltransferase involved in cell wall biosynthesis
MRIGLLAYSTDTGLGNQTYEFYKHLKPTKTLIADLSQYNSVRTHHEKYPDGFVYKGIPDDNHMNWLTRDVDLVFTAETPLNYSLYKFAAEKKVTTVLQYNYEFLDIPQLKKIPPTVLAAPTTWNLEKVINEKITRVETLPVPINRDAIKFRESSKLKTFVHIIGRPAVYDRNGTLAFLEAAKRLGDMFNYIIYMQRPTDEKTRRMFMPIDKKIREAQRLLPIKVIQNVANYADMYSEGEVLVMPRKYGGLCLPMNEALSAGMPVIMPDIAPNNNELPNEWLCKANYITRFVPRTEIDIYETDPDDLAEVMFRFNNSEFLKKANRKADEIANRRSWSNMKDYYLEKFESWIPNKNINLI